MSIIEMANKDVVRLLLKDTYQYPIPVLDGASFSAFVLAHQYLMLRLRQTAAAPGSPSHALTCIRRTLLSG